MTAAVRDYAAERERTAKRRLERLLDRVDGHKAAVRAQGDTFLAPHAVLTLLEDLEAVARGQVL
jgi:hypothetical protein